MSVTCPHDLAANTLTSLQCAVLNVLDETPRTVEELAGRCRRPNLWAAEDAPSRVQANATHLLTTRNVLCWLTGKGLAICIHGERYEPLRWRVP